MAPPGREDLAAGALVGGEAGDDLAEDGVGEVADAVGAFFILTHSGRRLLVVGGGSWSVAGGFQSLRGRQHLLGLGRRKFGSLRNRTARLHVWPAAGLGHRLVERRRTRGLNLSFFLRGWSQPLGLSFFFLSLSEEGGQ